MADHSPDIAIYGGFLALTFWWQSLPLSVVAFAGGWLIAWQGSLQHEVIHGHPTATSDQQCHRLDPAVALAAL